MDITIVMAYWNRKRQLLNTLKSIGAFGHNVRIIIIDDASTDNDDITHLADNMIKVVRLQDKWWVNPCIAYNTGFALVDTDVVIIQNPECIHVGDVIGHVLCNIRRGLYLNYSALAINKELTDKISMGYPVTDIIAPHMGALISAENANGIGWYNHPVHRPLAYHFCSAIMYEDLYDIGGFDERFADGSGFDDDDFIHRIRIKPLDINIIEHPFVVHQAHYPFYAGDVVNMMAINAAKFNMTRALGLWDVKKHNKIFTYA